MEKREMIGKAVIIDYGSGMGSKIGIVQSYTRKSIDFGTFIIDNNEYTVLTTKKEEERVSRIDPSDYLGVGTRVLKEDEIKRNYSELSEIGLDK